MNLMNLIALFFAALAVIGCANTGVIRSAPVKTDFLLERSYRLTVGVLLASQSGSLMPLGTFGSSSNLEEARRKLPAQAEGILEPGTLLLIRRVVTSSNPTVGKLTDIYAEIQTGVFKGRIVNVRTISDADWNTGSTRRDNKFLEPLGGPST
jgi:hypothetical protein